VIGLESSSRSLSAKASAVSEALIPQSSPCTPKVVACRGPTEKKAPNNLETHTIFRPLLPYNIENNPLYESGRGATADT
jgi:hypothetical protein